MKRKTCGRCKENEPSAENGILCNACIRLARITMGQDPGIEEPDKVADVIKPRFDLACGVCGKIKRTLVRGEAKDAASTCGDCWTSRQVVYLVGAEMINNFKIGCTRNMRQRWIDLRCGSPVPLSVFAMTDDTRLKGQRHRTSTGVTYWTGQDMEKELHAYFKDRHAHLEWFRFSNPGEAASEFHRAVQDLRSVGARTGAKAA